MYLNRLKGILLLFVVLCVWAPAHALHIKGGWMHYEFLGKNSSGNYEYRVTLKLYRDCATPNPGQNDAQVNLTVYNKANNTKYGDFTANNIATYPLNKTSYSDCINPKPQVCYVILEYATTITLPASSQGYTISFQRCCRINGIVNVFQPSNTLGTSYSIEIPGNINSSTFPENSSPVFSQRDTLLVCYNSPIVLDYSAVDPDGDSLVYYFTDAWDGASQNNPNPNTSPPPPFASLPYTTGFNAINPFGNNTNVVINRQTGLITGVSPGTTGEYVVAVGVDEYRNGRKLASTRKELHVNVANCSITAAKLPVSISSCDGFTVTIQNLSPSPSILTYFWDFGTGGATSTSAVPTFTFPDTGVYRVKLVVNRESSCSDSTYTNISVFPGFFPGFVADGSCYLNPFQFRDTTKTRYGGVDKWRWDFGNTTVSNDTSLLRNPQYTYPAPGTYNVNFTVGSNKGCLDTIIVPVSVLDRPLVTLANDTLICSIDTLQLNAMGTGVFTWDPASTLINANGPNALVFPKDTTKYYVTLNDRGCIARDSITVNTLDFITANAGRDTTICLTDSVQLHATTQGLGFSWQPAAIFDNPRAKSPLARPTAATTNVMLVANLGKCTATDALVLRTVPYPTVDAGAGNTICYADIAQLRGSTNGSSFSWAPSNLLQQPNQLSTTTRSLTQTTQFTLTVRDTLGCPKPVSDVVDITVRPQIKVFAGNDTSIVVGQPLQFTATSNGLSHRWSPGTALSNTSIVNPVAIFRTGNYPADAEYITYTLTSTTPEGCSGSDNIVVRIFKTPPSIFVPNGFTPNSDGLNDRIRPILAGIQKLEFFRVYNRYGQLVFESNQENYGWDGRVKGVLQPANGYVYQCRVIDFEGNPIFKKGTFVLIR
ncbi:MAG TPA: PKD domain-containing protein [Phnomibacter sp.]|nr:PKD domain-containing protein [Phnomibacter sp.]